MAARKEETEMKLVIAEKPSVANSLAAVLGATTRKDGYLEGGGWLVSWCLGHLAGLADAATYNPDYAKWRYDDLPILPETWRFTIAKDKRDQFDVLRTLLRREDVTEVVNACDAGREGELIFRTVYCLAGCTKPIRRLWISSMEDSAIREGFANLRPGTDYDGLHQAALCRAKADWLVGINATRLFSVLYHRTLNIGRVMSPTLALIVQREAEIDAFKPVPFYTVVLELPGFSVSGERMADKAAAQQLKTACQGAAVTVKKAERKEKSEKAPALYDLTTLQRDANRLLGFTAQQTLDYLQNLYEKKLCTYPRTDSRHLTSDMAASLPELVRLTAEALPFAAGMEISCNAAQVINDKKVTDHHAVIPTRNLQGADLTALPVGEKAVLELVALRLLCAVAQPYELMERDLTVYIIQEGENPAMAFDTADLDDHDGIFAVSREEWEESPEFDKLVKDRMAHQEEREQAFLTHKGDCFAIYQVKHTDELRDIRYEGLEWLQSIGRTVQRENYELVYTAPLLPADLKGDTTEQLFYRFNNEHPADYCHPSMSVSDIVAIKRDGNVSCHYCDSFGFEQVPGFLPDNPLKYAEMTVEDDYGMIDGILSSTSCCAPSRTMTSTRLSRTGTAK